MPFLLGNQGEDSKTLGEQASGVIDSGKETAGKVIDTVSNTTGEIIDNIKESQTVKGTKDSFEDVVSLIEDGVEVLAPKDLEDFDSLAWKHVAFIFGLLDGLSIGAVGFIAEKTGVSELIGLKKILDDNPGSVTAGVIASYFSPALALKVINFVAKGTWIFGKLLVTVLGGKAAAKAVVKRAKFSRIKPKGYTSVKADGNTLINYGAHTTHASQNKAIEFAKTHAPKLLNSTRASVTSLKNMKEFKELTVLIKKAGVKLGPDEIHRALVAGKIAWDYGSSHDWDKSEQTTAGVAAVVAALVSQGVASIIFKGAKGKQIKNRVFTMISTLLIAFAPGISNVYDELTTSDDNTLTAEVGVNPNSSVSPSVENRGILNSASSGYTRQSTPNVAQIPQF